MDLYRIPRRKTVTLRAESPFVFFLIEEEKNRLFESHQAFEIAVAHNEEQKCWDTSLKWSLFEQ